MAFKLGKADQKQIAEFADQLATLRQGVMEAVTKYNEKQEEAREYIAGIGMTMAESYADKSERWQESDRGRATQSWIEEFENIDLQEIEIEEDDENVTTLEGLPEEPEY